MGTSLTTAEVRNRVRRSGERPLPRQQLVKDNAGGKDVALPARGSAHEQLGCDVVGGTDQQAGGGQVRVFDAGDAEVHDLQFSVARKKQIGRFDVAMNHPLRMRVFEAVQQLQHQVEDVVRRHRLVLRHVVLQCAAVDALHGNVGETVLLAEVIDRGNRRMIEAARRARLIAKAHHQAAFFQLLDFFLADDFERDVAADRGIVRTMHNTHSAAAERADDLVFADGAQLGHLALPRWTNYPSIIFRA